MPNDSAPPPASPSGSRNTPYWQNPGVRPGFDADQREFEPTAPGPRKWYNHERWELERERLQLVGKPQAPWRDASALSDILETVTGRLGIAPSVAMDYFRDEWERIVGADVARHCRPVSLEKGTLELSVSSSVWMFTLRRIARTTLLSAVKASRHGAEVERIALRPSATGGRKEP